MAIAPQQLASLDGNRIGPLEVTTKLLRPTYPLRAIQAPAWPAGARTAARA